MIKHSLTIMIKGKNIKTLRPSMTLHDPNHEGLMHQVLNLTHYGIVSRRLLILDPDYRPSQKIPEHRCFFAIT